jgi:hypothetical protein
VKRSQPLEFVHGGHGFGIGVAPGSSTVAGDRPVPPVYHGHVQAAVRVVGIAVLVAGLSLSLTAAVEPARAARSPTYTELVTIMDAFNEPGRSWASRCAKIVVSTVDPRYARLTIRRPLVRACVRAGEVGDGYVVYRRADPRALRWRELYEASDPPRFIKPRPMPHAVCADLFPEPKSC